MSKPNGNYSTEFRQQSVDLQNLKAKPLQQLFDNTDGDVRWLVIGAPEAELRLAEESDTALSYPTDPEQLPKELGELRWPFFA